MEDFKRAKKLYGNDVKNEIFQKYLVAAENHITFLKAELYVKLSELDVPLEEQKSIISKLAILDPKQDVAWDSLMINYNLLIEVRVISLINPAVKMTNTHRFHDRVKTLKTTFIFTCINQRLH